MNNSVLEQIEVIYKCKERNIEKIKDEINEIEYKIKTDDTLLHKEYLKIKDRKDYLEKRLPIEINELRGMYIAIKILNKAEETDSNIVEFTNNVITLSDEQLDIIGDKFETTEYGWHCDGCNCGTFEIEIKDLGFAVVSRSCRKSNSTPQGMQYSFSRFIRVYDSSIIDDGDALTSEDIDNRGIKYLGKIDTYQTQIILEYARENTIRDLGFDEYGNRMEER